MREPSHDFNLSDASEMSIGSVKQRFFADNNKMQLQSSKYEENKRLNSRIKPEIIDLKRVVRRCLSQENLIISFDKIPEVEV